VGLCAEGRYDRPRCVAMPAQDEWLWSSGAEDAGREVRHDQVRLNMSMCLDTADQDTSTWLRSAFVLQTQGGRQPAQTKQPWICLFLLKPAKLLHSSRTFGMC